MLIWLLQKVSLFRRAVCKLGRKRSKKMFGQIERFLKKSDKLLDIGSGTCIMYDFLKQRKFKVTPLDVQNISFVENAEPIIYDGDKIPFEDKKFDVSLLLTVLHHVKNPIKIIQEAKRVSKRIIIIEDVHKNFVHKYVNYFFDVFINLDFASPFYFVKTDEQWQSLFKDLRLNIKAIVYERSFLIFKHAVYCLEAK